MPRIAFSKYEGLGNDFIIVEASGLGGRTISAAEAIMLCDRHRGIGADGVLTVGVDGGPSMEVINADGSQPEMCGNGLRCVAAHLVRTGVVQAGTVNIATSAGPHRCETSAAGGEFMVDVAMRPASFAPADIGLTDDHPWVAHAIDVGGSSLELTAVSMGNPHAVTFDDVGDARLQLGPLVQTHAAFRDGANVGFAQMSGPDAMTLHVFERGAGWTQACGTGACAAACAAVRTKRAERGTGIVVTLPGGDLAITVGAPSEPVQMRGPARHVFDGEIDVP